MTTDPLLDELHALDHDALAERLAALHEVLGERHELRRELELPAHEVAVPEAERLPRGEGADVEVGGDVA